jgi:hypothetical protein
VQPGIARRAGESVYFATLGYFRRRRNSRLVAGLEGMEQVLGRPARVLDVGGVETFWQAVGLPRGCRLTILNLPEALAWPGWFPGELDIEKVEGSALDLSRWYGEVDVVVCNSVIEHVGRWADIARCAEELRSVTSDGWVQTPAFGFPVEPHFALPVIHWLAQPVQARLLGVVPHFGSTSDRSPGRLREKVEANNLLTWREFRHLFADATHQRERVGPLTKSYIATWGRMDRVWD